MSMCAAVLTFCLRHFAGTVTLVRIAREIREELMLRADHAIHGDSPPGQWDLRLHPRRTRAARR
jgi:hypothetical protein